MNEGIDAVIVDSVLAIRKGLTDTDQEPCTEPASDATSTVPERAATIHEEVEVLKRQVVDTINGVPIYADAGLEQSTAAIFS